MSNSAASLSGVVCDKSIKLLIATTRLCRFSPDFLAVSPAVSMLFFSSSSRSAAVTMTVLRSPPSNTCFTPAAAFGASLAISSNCALYSRSFRFASVKACTLSRISLLIAEKISDCVRRSSSRCASTNLVTAVRLMSNALPYSLNCVAADGTMRTIASITCCRRSCSSLVRFDLPISPSYSVSSWLISFSCPAKLLSIFLNSSARSRSRDTPPLASSLKKLLKVSITCDSGPAINPPITTLVFSIAASSLAKLSVCLLTSAVESAMARLATFMAASCKNKLRRLSSTFPVQAPVLRAMRSTSASKSRICKPRLSKINGLFRPIPVTMLSTKKSMLCPVSMARLAANSNSVGKFLISTPKNFACVAACISLMSETALPVARRSCCISSTTETPSLRARLSNERRNPSAVPASWAVSLAKLNTCCAATAPNAAAMVAFTVLKVSVMRLPESPRSSILSSVCFRRLIASRTFASTSNSIVSTRSAMAAP